MGRSHAVSHSAQVRSHEPPETEQKAATAQTSTDLLLVGGSPCSKESLCEPGSYTRRAATRLLSNELQRWVWEFGAPKRAWPQPIHGRQQLVASCPSHSRAQKYLHFDKKRRQIVFGGAP